MIDISESSRSVPIANVESAFIERYSCTESALSIVDLLSFHAEKRLNAKRRAASFYPVFLRSYEIKDHE